MKTIKLLTIITFANAAVMSFGATHDSDGCGVGWQYSNKKTIAATSTRGTTNGGMQTSGMSSGTMGCEKHPFAKNEQQAVDFAATNFETLSIEMAEGQGEYLAGLAQSMGCDSAAFSQMAQDNYGTIGATESGVEMYRQIKQQIKSDALSCNIG